MDAAPTILAHVTPRRDKRVSQQVMFIPTQQKGRGSFLTQGWCSNPGTVKDTESWRDSTRGVARTPRAFHQEAGCRGGWEDRSRARLTGIVAQFSRCCTLTKVLDLSGLSYIIFKTETITCLPRSTVRGLNGLLQVEHSCSHLAQGESSTPRPAGDLEPALLSKLGSFGAITQTRDNHQSDPSGQEHQSSPPTRPSMSH